jgi:hypothetical protein
MGELEKSSRSVGQGCDVIAPLFMALRLQLFSENPIGGDKSIFSQ